MSSKPPILQYICPELVGNKVILQTYKNGDGKQIFEAVEESRAHLEPWQAWVRAIQTQDDAEELARRKQAEWLVRACLSWSIREYSTLAFLGNIQLENIDWSTPSLGIGYWIRSSAQGKGYVTQAAQLVCKVAFETLSAKRVHIECDARNRRSAAVAHRLGFMREGQLRNERLDSRGELSNTLQFGMIPAEYEEEKQKWYHK